MIQDKDINGLVMIVKNVLTGHMHLCLHWYEIKESSNILLSGSSSSLSSSWLIKCVLKSSSISFYLVFVILQLRYLLISISFYLLISYPQSTSIKFCEFEDIIVLYNFWKFHVNIAIYSNFLERHTQSNTLNTFKDVF